MRIKRWLGLLGVGTLLAGFLLSGSVAAVPQGVNAHYVCPSPGAAYSHTFWDWHCWGPQLTWAPETGSSNLGSWNNKISSLTVAWDAACVNRLTLWDGFYWDGAYINFYNGAEINHLADYPLYGGNWNDKASSMWVYGGYAHPCEYV